VATKKKLTVLERLCPEQHITFNGVLVVVKPLRASRVPDCLDLLDATGARLLLGSWKELARQSHPALMALINECCEIPEDPSVKAEDYPVKLVGEVLNAILDQNVTGGNWLALGQRMGLVGTPQSDTAPTNSGTQSAE
jgi:hypothetical protein